MNQPAALARIMHHRLESPLKQRTHPLTTPVEPYCVANVQPLHRPAQVTARTRQLQVIVVGHQHVAQYPSTESFGQFAQQLLESPEAFDIAKDATPLNSPRHHVAPGSRKNHSQGRAIAPDYTLKQMSRSSLFLESLDAILPSVPRTREFA
jgi:hypothetical protein